jgi:type I restriction enzyme S subunit
MSDVSHQTLGYYESRGDMELGRGDVISTGDLASHPGSYPVYSSSAVGDGVFGRYGLHMFDEELITWSIDGGGRPFHRKKHRFSVTNVGGFLRIKRPDRWDYGYLHSVLEGLQSRIQFDYQMKAHPSVIRDLYRFDCIPIEEQRSIAAARDTLDTTIRQTEAIIAKLKQVKQGLLHDLLTRGIAANGELRPPQSEAPHLYKASPLGWIPVEWQLTPADHACEAVIDCKNRTPPEAASGHPVIRTPNVRDGRFVREGLAYTDSLSYAIWTQRGQPRKGDVLITREAPVGEVCLLPEDMADGCLGQRMMMYRPEPSVLSSEFMLIALLSAPVQKSLLDLAGGSTVGHVKVGDIRTLRIPVPSLDEQERIVRAYGSSEARLMSEQALSTKLQKQKSGLMDDLLTGRVRVTPLLAQAPATQP